MKGDSRSYMGVKREDQRYAEKAYLRYRSGDGR